MNNALSVIFVNALLEYYKLWLLISYLQLVLWFRIISFYGNQHYSLHKTSNVH